MGTIIKRHSPFNHLFRNFDRLFDELDKIDINTDSLLERTFIWGDSFPKLNIYKEDKNLIVEATVAGLDKEGLHVEVEDEVLTISYTPIKNQPEEREFYRREIKESSFIRKLQLPEVDVDGITSETKDGILKIVIPVVEPEVKKRVIDID